MGDCEEAHLVHMCNTLKAIEEKHGDLSYTGHDKKHGICSHTKLSHSWRERERERENAFGFKLHERKKNHEKANNSLSYRFTAVKND